MTRYLLIGGNLLNLTILLIRFGGLILIRFVIVMPNGMTNVLVLNVRFMWYVKLTRIYHIWVVGLLVLLLVL